MLRGKKRKKRKRLVLWLCKMWVNSILDSGFNKVARSSNSILVPKLNNAQTFLFTKFKSMTTICHSAPNKYNYPNFMTSTDFTHIPSLG